MVKEDLRVVATGVEGRRVSELIDNKYSTLLPFCVLYLVFYKHQNVWTGFNGF